MPGPPGGTPGESDPISEPATPVNETYEKLAKSESFLLYKIFKSNLRPFFAKNQKNGKKSIFFGILNGNNLVKNQRIFKIFVPNVIYRLLCNRSGLW